jgi:N-acetylglucosamine kinase-like BadF-type ATPase
VGRAALNLVARLADGRAPAPSGRDSLTPRILAAFGITAASELPSVIAQDTSERARIAALAPLVAEAAAEEPSFNALILEPAGRELGLAGLAVLRSLAWPATEPVPIALAGGFLLGCSEAREACIRTVQEVARLPIAVRDVPRPVEGALILARRALDECS